MSDRVLSPDVERRLGVYKRLGDVPDRYRLYQHSNAYEGRDVWDEWMAVESDEKNVSERYFEVSERAGRLWKEHMEERGRHHALAQPGDVEAWVARLLDGRNLRTVYENYWVQLERFYEWLTTSVGHPHVYNPVLMAVLHGDAAGKIWERKIEGANELARQRAEEGRIG